MESMLVRGTGGSDEASLFLLIGGCALIFFGLMIWMVFPTVDRAPDVRCPKCGGANSPVDSSCRYCSETLPDKSAAVPNIGLAPAVAQSSSSIADQIERLSALKQQGAITDTEYQTAKARLFS